MKKRKGLYKYGGYYAFRIAAELHGKLFPGAPCDGGTQKMQHIFHAFEKVYTDGVEDALQLDENQLKAERRKIMAKEWDV